MFVKVTLHQLNRNNTQLLRQCVNYYGHKFINKVEIIYKFEITGGILSEPLARIGAEVTGLDPSSEVIEKLQTRIRPDMNNLLYVHNTIEQHAETYPETYDAVVASEVVEHVTNKKQFIKSCVECLKPKGNLFLTTINKSLFSKFLFITMAEDVAEVVPKGTHEYEKFITSQDLRNLLEEGKFLAYLLFNI